MEGIRLAVCNLSHGAKRNEQIKAGLKVVLVFSETVEHLGCALRVANIADFFIAGRLNDVFEHGRDVVLAHLLPVKSPVFSFVFVVVVLSVTQTVSVATGVAKPHVVATTSGNESGRNAIVVHDPGVG